VNLNIALKYLNQVFFLIRKFACLRYKPLQLTFPILKAYVQIEFESIILENSVVGQIKKFGIQFYEYTDQDNLKDELTLIIPEDDIGQVKGLLIKE